MFNQVFKKIELTTAPYESCSKCGTKKTLHHFLIFSLHAKPINPNGLHFNYQYIKKPIVQSMCFFGDKFCCSFNKKLRYFWKILILMYIQLVLPIIWKILQKIDILELKKKKTLIIII